MVALLGVLVVAAAAGCARMSYESTPAGAAVEFSRTGGEPWHPIAIDETGAPRTTPFRASDPVAGFAFVRAVKEGHVASDRRLVDFGRWRWWWSGRLTFELMPTREAEARARMAEGYVFHRGAWARPEDEGLVERDGAWMTVAEAEAEDRRAAGLVEFDGAWMTASEAEARQREELLARGYEEFRGRLLPPDEAARLRGIAAQVARLAEEPDSYATDNALLEPTGRTPRGLRVRVFNATSLDIEVLLSGATTEAVPLGAYQEKTIDGVPGEVAVAVLPVASGVYRRFLGEFALEATHTYTFTYLGLELGRDFDAELAGATGRIERPTLDIPEVRMPEGYDPNAERQQGAGGGAAPRGGRGGGGGGGGRGGR